MPKRQILNLKQFFEHNATLDKGLELRIIEDQRCICHNRRLVIPKPLQRRATVWYHHYLQHPGHNCLKGTMNILERNANYRPIHNKIMQNMPNEQNTYTKVWPPATQNSNKHSMEGFMCRPNLSIQAKMLGWISNRFHGTHHDQPRLELVRNIRVTASHLTIDQDGQG